MGGRGRCRVSPDEIVPTTAIRSCVSLPRAPHQTGCYRVVEHVTAVRRSTGCLAGVFREVEGRGDSGGNRSRHRGPLTSFRCRPDQFQSGAGRSSRAELVPPSFHSAALCCQWCAPAMGVARSSPASRVERCERSVEQYEDGRGLRDCWRESCWTGWSPIPSGDIRSRCSGPRRRHWNGGCMRRAGCAVPCSPPRRWRQPQRSAR